MPILACPMCIFLIDLKWRSAIIDINHFTKGKKMKKLIMLSVLALSSISFAADKLDGCGLGWQVTAKKTYTGTFTRATTNAFVPPTFGMTTGTLGCDQLEIGAKDQEAADFIATNFQSLKSELAAGQGEYVSALAVTMGCQSSSAAFGSKLQQSYNTVVAPATDAAQLYKNIKSETKEVCI